MFEDRFAEINAVTPEKPTAEDLKAIEEMNLVSSVSLEDFKKEMEGYSGKLVIRLPRSLHRKLKLEAEAEGVSLNQYMLYKLAK